VGAFPHADITPKALRVNITERAKNSLITLDILSIYSFIRNSLIIYLFSKFVE
jgi:hypothetical protein